VARVRLDSWKSIAEYLRRSPRTVQRWHADIGLPVHHFGGSKGPVFSYSEELDAWLSGFADGQGEEANGADDILGDRKEKSAALAAQADEMWELRTEENLSAIAALYRSAIDQNPSNAAAFIGLANALTLAGLLGAMKSSAARPRAVEALQRASRLGCDLPDARCAAAWLQMIHERKWKRAREGFEEVLIAQPRSSYALSGRALLHIVEGNLRYASHYLADAWKQNALASSSNAFLAWTQYLARDYDQAIETVAQSRASGEMGSLNAATEAFALIQSGPVTAQLGRLEAFAATFPRSMALQGALGYACAVADRAERAREILNNLKRLQGDSAYPLALIYTGLDEPNQAISCLEASYAEGSLWSLGFHYDPILQPLRADSRSESRLRRLGAHG
jgi:thioredoxin-like negative regulator of GroEL